MASPPSNGNNGLTVGNIASSQSGVANFSIQIIADPGNYTLTFEPLDGHRLNLLPAELDLSVRHCSAGEANTSVSRHGIAAVAGRAHCEVCRPGAVSLDPLSNNGNCIPCSVGEHANCTGVALIPTTGFWHSNPRSPLVHRCLVTEACENDAGRGAMQEWAVKHATRTIAELDLPPGSPVFDEYVDLQCATGYQVSSRCS